MARAAVWACTMMAAVAAAGMGTAHAGNAEQPVPFKTTATVWLDAQGVPQKVETPDRLPAAIREAIELKPERHEFREAPGKILRFMSMTGG